MNSQHSNIKFTIEQSTKANTLFFLDVQVELLNDGYETTVWCKSTNTGLLLNFNAMSPKIWKFGLIMCFLHQAKCICSNYELYLKEVQMLRLIFSNNGYSNWFIDNTLKQYEAVAYARGFGGQTPPFSDGTGSEDLSFYFNDPLLLRTELAEIANKSLLFNSPV